MLGPLIALLSALTAGSLAYAVTGGLSLSGSLVSRKLKNVSGQGREETTWRKIGLRARRSPSLGRYLPIGRVEADLPWAHLSGKYRTWQVDEIVGASLVGASLGLIVGLVAFEGGLIALAVAGLGFYIPILLVRSAANDMRRTFRRQLPEMTQILAAEVGAGSSMEKALERLADSPTAVGLIFGDVLARAKSEGKALFSSEENSDCGLVDAAAYWRVPDLTKLVAQIDVIHLEGVYGAQKLSSLARRVATEYLGERERKAESLENDLLLPLTLFFFVPFLAMVLGPIFVQLFSVL